MANPKGIAPEGMAGASLAPRDVERNLIVERIPKENLSLAAGVFDLKGTLTQYKSDWRVVSHTFAIQEDGSALLTCLLEREIT